MTIQDSRPAAENEQKAVNFAPAVFANRFFLGDVGEHGVRLTLAEQGGLNVTMRGAYFLTPDGAAALHRLLEEYLGRTLKT